MLGLEEYVTEHFKSICCSIWYEDIGDDALGTGNLSISGNCVDEVLKLLDYL